MSEPGTHEPQSNLFHRLPPSSRWLAFLAAAIALGMLAYLLYPFNFQAHTDDRWLALTRPTVHPLIILVLMFIPLGIAEGWVAHHMVRPPWAVALVMFDVLLLGVIIETAQLWLPQHSSSVIDLVAYVLGGTAGGVLADRLAPWWRQRPSDQEDQT